MHGRFLITAGRGSDMGLPEPPGFADDASLRVRYAPAKCVCSSLLIGTAVVLFPVSYTHEIFLISFVPLALITSDYSCYQNIEDRKV
jgi:hypothetical protein